MKIGPGLSDPRRGGRSFIEAGASQNFRDGVVVDDSCAVGQRQSRENAAQFPDVSLPLLTSQSVDRAFRQANFGIDLSQQVTSDFREVDALSQSL